jgi:hypothetical protein
MKRKKANPRSGSTLEALLRADEQYEDCQTDAIKKVLVYKLGETIAKKSLQSRRYDRRNPLARAHDCRANPKYS